MNLPIMDIPTRRFARTRAAPGPICDARAAHLAGSRTAEKPTAAAAMVVVTSGLDSRYSRVPAFRA
jgi:hypothetical protein